MRLMTVGTDSTPNFPKLSLSLASTPEGVREVQRLRYKVFVEAMALETLENHEGLERDEDSKKILSRQRKELEKGIN